MELKNLSYWPEVKKSPAIVRAVECMDKFFEGEPTSVTSGFRTPIDQLNTILQHAVRHGIDTEFPELKKNIGCGVEFTVHIPELNRDLYWWQRTWSKLLNLNNIVNPPVPAECLFDYQSGDRNKRGEIIQISPHQRGIAFDLGGGKNLIEKAKRVVEAKESGECFITDYRVEKVNNAVHVGVMRLSA